MLLTADAVDAELSDFFSSDLFSLDDDSEWVKKVKCILNGQGFNATDIET